MHVDGLSLKFDAKIAKRISRLSFFIYICAPLIEGDLLIADY